CCGTHWPVGRAVTPAAAADLNEEEEEEEEPAQPDRVKDSPMSSSRLVDCPVHVPRINEKVVCAESCRAVSACSARDVHTIGPENGHRNPWSMRLTALPATSPNHDRTSLRVLGRSTHRKPRS